MLPFILTQPEAKKIADFKLFILRRKVGDRGVYIPPGNTLEPDLKAALLKVSFYQKGRLFYTQEHFKHTYDANKHETWIQYMADGRMFPQCPLKARLEYGKDGIYTANLQHEAFARCRLEVADVDLVYKNVVTPTGRVTPIMQWEWAITFKKVEIVTHAVKEGSSPVRDAPATSPVDGKGPDESR